MGPYAILRVEKLRRMGNVGGSGQHTFREVDTPNADPARADFNTVLKGPDTASGIVQAVRQRAALATHKAKDAVPCLEYLCAFSPGAPVRDVPQYFRDALAWLEAQHGEANVVGAVVHDDETTPHMCAYVVPLVHRPAGTRLRNVAGGRDAEGNRRRKIIEQRVEESTWLSAAAYVGSRRKLAAMQTSYAQEVARKHGLKRGIPGSRARHIKVKTFYALLDGHGAPNASAEELAKLAAAAVRVATQRKGEAERAARELERQQEEARRFRMQAERERLEEVARKRDHEAALDAEYRRRQEELEAQWEQAQAAERAHRTRLETELRDLRQKLANLRAWVVHLVQECWAALWTGGVRTVQTVLENASHKLKTSLGEPPTAWREDAWELPNGEWRWLVFDPDGVERAEGLARSREQAMEEAKEWIAHQSAGQQLGIG